jgi:hypothetical protein
LKSPKPNSTTGAGASCTFFATRRGSRWISPCPWAVAAWHW